MGSRPPPRNDAHLSHLVGHQSLGHPSQNTRRGQLEQVRDAGSGSHQPSALQIPTAPTRGRALSRGPGRQDKADDALLLWMLMSESKETSGKAHTSASEGGLGNREQGRVDTGGGHPSKPGVCAMNACLQMHRDMQGNA